MAFSCEIKSINGVDLLKKYDINHQLLGIARSTIDEEEYYYPHSNLSEIREIFCAYSRVCGNSITREQSQNLIAKIQEIIRYNLGELKQSHCDNCKCPDIIPKAWDIEKAKRFLSIPLEEVYKAYGGY